MGIRKSKPSASNTILWTLLFLSLGILAFFFAGPVGTVPFLFIVISNIMFIFQKEEKETSRESPPIDRKRDGIMFSEISDLGFAPPSINEFSAFLIDGDDYYGKFFKFSERYMFVGINASGDKISQINALNKLLVNFKKVEFEFLRFVHSEEVLKKYSAPNIRICYIEASPAEPFDEFYLRILSDNSAYEYECLLRDFKFYKISEIKN